MKKTILITGASGFVGKRYLVYNKDKYTIMPVSLRKTTPEQIDYSKVDTIVHLAGMAHQMQKIDDQIYFDVNYELTKNFAQAAKNNKVKHFIFISTIKVFGEHQKAVLNENSPCEPVNDPYGESKLKAEQVLEKMNDDEFCVSIVRPPLVYGPGVKGNLIRFLELANKSYPLPFKAVDNKRTMVFLDNLIELINRLTDAPQNGIFLAGDRAPISTTTLISTMRKQMGKSPNLFVMPTPFKALLKMLKPGLAIRLYDSLEMNTSNTNQRLNFEPPYSIEEGIKSMTDWFKNKNNN